MEIPLRRAQSPREGGSSIKAQRQRDRIAARPGPHPIRVHRLLHAQAGQVRYQAAAAGRLGRIQLRLESHRVHDRY